MGYALAFGPCIGCKRLFHFNPLRVPSCSAVTGKREPICAECVERVNPIRIANGLDPIVPHWDAYGACDEVELE
jgi:hypothetical protein